MPGQIFRLYADTSVFGGVFDEEFENTSRIFFDQIKKGKFSLVVSALIREEVSTAPAKVQRFFEDMVDFAEICDITNEAISLQQAYLRRGIIGPTALADALHVALATVSACRAIVSWNFRHIVHFQKIPLYNGVNRSEGYLDIDIHSPQEVIAYEDEDI